MRVFSCSPKANLNPWPLKNEHIDTDLHHPRLLIRMFNIQRYISATDVIGSCPFTHTGSLSASDAFSPTGNTLVLLREDASRACRKKTTHLL